ncbi:MAG: response regulator [Candidatus Melainabacteria bacterium]|nr:response regulator [Candidatus Melainabacteria bacterium]
MERLSCIAIDFFKRYCVNKEGLKFFVEDFINGYSLFKGLLKVRIKREEVELYPAFILIQTGVMYSEVLHYVQEQEANASKSQKTIMLFDQSESSKTVLSLALEMTGYKVAATHSIDQVPSISKTLQPDLILIDVTNARKNLHDLIMEIREQVKPGIQLVGYSNKETEMPEEKLSNKLDDFISKPAVNVEEFSKRISTLLSKEP